jgi:hypothetical protein
MNETMVIVPVAASSVRVAGTGDTAAAVRRRKGVVSTATTSSPDYGATANGPPPGKHRDRTHYLYIAVIGAVVLGIVVGLVAPWRR